MKQLHYKSNINCGSCVTNVTNTLNETVGAGNWTVDIANKDKILTINSETATQEQVEQSLNKIGYRIEEIESNFQIK